MIVALLLSILLQDGPVRTAPEPVPQDGATAAADPGPPCTFGGRPVSGPECPTPEARIAFDLPPPGPQAAAPETGPSDEACADLANRPSGRTGFDCAIRLDRSRRPGGRVGSLGFSTTEGTSGEVPAWALADPATWETSQCGVEGDEACRRQARNRLAMARAGIAAEPAAATGGGQAAAPQNCRMVMRRSESGFGGSLSRLCGDGAEAEAALDRLEGSLRPVVQPCDQPATLESQDSWIARCRALPPR